MSKLDGELELRHKVPNPSRIRFARKRRGLTQGALADRIDVIRRTIVGYESGEYPPASDALDRLVEELRFPREFFFGDDLDVPSMETGSFRSTSKMTAVHRDMALSQAALGVYFSQWLEQKLELPEADIPDLGRQPDPEAAAETLRSEWKLGVLSIRNMVHLLESKGVRVFSLAVDAREVDAFSMWLGKTPFVFLNTLKTSEHSRFDAAHELAHLVLHKHGPPTGKEAEREANAFASAFLMPRASVLAQLRITPTYQSMIQLKKNWTTSVSATAYRLHELGLVSDWQYRHLCIEIAKRGRANEPESAPRETSQVLPKALAILHNEGFSRKKIAQQLTIPPSELEQLLFGLVLAAIDGASKGGTKTLAHKLKRIK